MNYVEMFEKQNEVIRLETEIIDELFVVLMQHVTVSELSGLNCMGEMKEAALLRQQLE